MPGYDDALRRLGERIRRLRKAQGLTQRQLAEKAGVFDVGELERGRKVKGGGPVNPRLETLWRIAQALDCTVTELFGAPTLDPDTERIGRLLQQADSATRRKAVAIVETMCR